MSHTVHYCIAGFGIVVTLPEGDDFARLLPHAEGFRCEARDNEPILRFTTAEPLPSTPKESLKLISEDCNDLGRVRLFATNEGYHIEQSYLDSELCHHMALNSELNCATAVMNRQDPRFSESLSSLLRIAYSLSILRHEAVAIHASAICHQGEALLFLGKSGTGKSTHARLWVTHGEGCSLLNDDNPTLRWTNQGLKAYGTPWSGKTHCYRNEGYPVRGIARLSQAAENRFRLLDEREALLALMPSCTLLRENEAIEDRFYDLMERILETTPVAHLACRADKEAYRCCRAGFYPDTTPETEE